MSSGTPDARAVSALPTEPTAAARVEAWVNGSSEFLHVAGCDLRGADFSGVDLSEFWLTDADMRGVRLVGSDLYRAYLNRSDLSDADLTRASLVKTEMSGACLIRTNLSGAEMTRTEIYGADARQAVFAGADMRGVLIDKSDMRGASFKDVQLFNVSLHVRFDDQTDFTGMAGTMFSTMTYVHSQGEQEFTGQGLRDLLRARGADVEILEPATPRPMPQRYPRGTARWS